MVDAMTGTFHPVFPCTCNAEHLPMLLVPAVLPSFVLSTYFHHPEFQFAAPICRWFLHHLRLKAIC